MTDWDWKLCLDAEENVTDLISENDELRAENKRLWEENKRLSLAIYDLAYTPAEGGKTATLYVRNLEGNYEEWVPKARVALREK